MKYRVGITEFLGKSLKIFLLYHGRNIKVIFTFSSHTEYVKRESIVIT